MSTTTASEPAKGTQAYCITCKTYFKNMKGAMPHIKANEGHLVHYIDALDPKSRDAHLSMGLPEAIVQMIYQEQLKGTK